MINFMSKNHYTYAYLREDRTPYYIGRGTGRRAFKDHRHIPVPPRDRILFLKTNLTYAESVDHEKYIIYILGRKDLGTGILRNLTDGGEGTIGFKFSEKQRQYDRNPRKGPRTAIHGEKHYKSKLSDDDRRFIAANWVPGNRNSRTGTGRQLADQFGLDIETIRQIAKDPRWTS